MDKTLAERYTGYALVGLGVLLYLVFGIVKGAPTDTGVYSITVIPAVIGLALIWRTSGTSAGS